MGMETELPALPPLRRNLYWAFREQAENPTGPGNDPIYAKMSEAVADEIIYGELGDVIESSLEFREQSIGKAPLEAHHAMQLIRRDLQDKFLKMFPDEYPSAAIDVGWNKEAIKKLLNNPSLLFEFEADLALEEVRSNVDQRYAALALIAKMYRDRVGDNPNILDVGCSTNNGLKVMALSNVYPFNEVEVVEPNSTELTPNKTLTKVANTLLASRLAIGASVGLDIFGLNFDKKTWVRSCSFYPTELLKPALLMRFDDLTNTDVREIGFYQANFLNGDDMKGLPTSFAKTRWEASRPRGDQDRDSLLAMAQYIGEKHQDKELFDLVTFCTSMYLMKAAERVRAIELAKTLVKKSGLIVIQDFADLSPRSRTGLRFHNDFQYAPFPYRLYVIPGNAKDQSPRHIFSWENGRARKLMLGTGRVSINGTARTPKELLRAA